VTERAKTSEPDQGTVATTPKREPNRVRVRWIADQEFDTGRPGGPVARLDGRGVSGQSPVDAVLSGLAACASVDVVEILGKRRTPVTALEVDVAGTRFEGTPRRLVHIALAFTITGDGIERVHAERAVELAITKYCSVQSSLDKSIPIDWTVKLTKQ
jgi:putative redox protein